jgi:hypothetical protein
VGQGCRPCPRCSRSSRETEEDKAPTHSGRKYIEKFAFDLTGSLAHTGQVSHHHQLGINGMVIEGDMTDRQRELARELLMASRPSQPKALPPVLTRPTSRVAAR